MMRFTNHTDDHYPPITEGIASAEEQDIPAPRQIFSSGESNEVQLRRLGELMWVYIETMPSTALANCQELY